MVRSRAIEEQKRKLKLSKIQRETLIGILLGDACLETSNQGRTYRLKIEQSARHQAYVMHLMQVFADWVRSEPTQRFKRASTGAETESWSFQSYSHAAFRFYAQQFYADRQKQVPPLIHRWLTPRGLAYWFMDDGSMKSKQSKGVIFNTQGFPPEQVDRLVEVLQQNFGLEAKRRKQKDGIQIYVSGRSHERFVEWIDPYLIDSMRYKVPLPRRTYLPKE